MFGLIQNLHASKEKETSQKEKNSKLYAQIRKFEERNRGMKKKINDALLMNLGNGVIDGMDQAKDGDEMNQLRRKLREVIGGKRRIQNPAQKKVRLGEKSEII